MEMMEKQPSNANRKDVLMWCIEVFREITTSQHLNTILNDMEAAENVDPGDAVAGGNTEQDKGSTTSCISVGDDSSDGMVDDDLDIEMLESISDSAVTETGLYHQLVGVDKRLTQNDSINTMETRRNKIFVALNGAGTRTNCRKTTISGHTAKEIINFIFPHVLGSAGVEQVQNILRENDMKSSYGTIPRRGIRAGEAARKVAMCEPLRKYLEAVECEEKMGSDHSNLQFVVNTRAAFQQHNSYNDLIELDANKDLGLIYNLAVHGFEYQRSARGYSLVEGLLAQLLGVSRKYVKNRQHSTAAISIFIKAFGYGIILLLPKTAKSK